MKKALKITGLIFGIVFVVTAVIFLIVGIVVNATAADVVKELMNQGYTQAAAQASVITTATTFYVLGGIFAVGGIFSFVAVHFAKKEEVSRASMIALGVFNILFASEVVGILSIVYGAKFGK